MVTDYTDNNAVKNAFKIKTAQIDTTTNLIKENDRSLIELVKIFWKVEDTGIHVEQDSFIKSFESSTEYRDSRYTIKLPWKGKYKNIQDNFLPARNRLFSFLKRLSKNSEQLNHCDTIIEDQERDGVIKPVDTPEDTERYIITHFEKQLKKKEKHGKTTNSL